MLPNPAMITGRPGPRPLSISSLLLKSAGSNVGIIQFAEALALAEKGVKWETLLSPSDAEEEGEGGGGGAEGKEEKKEPKTFAQKLVKALKILLPHVGLTFLLLSYIAGGAAIFQWLETGMETQKRRIKLLNITRFYEKIFNESFKLCTENPEYIDVKNRLEPILAQLSMAHEWDEKFDEGDQIWNPDVDNITSRWTFSAAVLYALTVITTTGYDHITPLTNAGRLFAVFFGLIGIPLMFITAADIGKFLSEVVTNSYTKVLQLTRFIRRTLARLGSRSRRTAGARTEPTVNGDLKNKEAAQDPALQNPLGIIYKIRDQNCQH